jgi:hypothetical protein
MTRAGSGGEGSGLLASGHSELPAAIPSRFLAAIPSRFLAAIPSRFLTVIPSRRRGISSAPTR